jgi:hypothetical protein
VCQGSTQCEFFSDSEFFDHIFVICPFVNSIWQWITRYNNFDFTGDNVQDLWYLDCSIPLKDAIIIETVRGVVLWTIWLK